MESTWGTNLLTGSVAHAALRPTGERRRNKGVLCLAGLGGQAETFIPGFDPPLTLVRDQGFSVVSCDVDQLWGNSTQRTRIAELRTDAITAGFIPSGKVHLLALSMGTCAATMFAASNPTLVASITLILPAIDIQDIYDNDRLGDNSSFTAAYGGRPGDSENPINAANTAVLAKIPSRIFYTQNDPICIAAKAEEFGAAVGAQMEDWGTLAYGSPVGHAIDQDLDTATYGEWIARND